MLVDCLAQNWHRPLELLPYITNLVLEVVIELIRMCFSEISVDKVVVNSHIHLLPWDHSLIFKSYRQVIDIDMTTRSSKDDLIHTLVDVKVAYPLVWDSDV